MFFNLKTTNQFKWVTCVSHYTARIWSRHNRKFEPNMTTSLSWLSHTIKPHQELHPNTAKHMYSEIETGEQSINYLPSQVTWYGHMTCGRDRRGRLVGLTIKTPESIQVYAGFSAASIAVARNRPSDFSDPSSVDWHLYEWNKNSLEAYLLILSRLIKSKIQN